MCNASDVYITSTTFELVIQEPLLDINTSHIKFVYLELLVSLYFSNPGIPPPRFLQESLTQWIETDSRPTQCGQRMHTIPPGASHFLGTCFVQDPVSGQLL